MRDLRKVLGLFELKNNLGSVDHIIRHELIQATEQEKMEMAAALKAIHPNAEWKDIFAVVDYDPTYSYGACKSMLRSLHEYHQVMKGDHGQRVYLGYPSLDDKIRGIRPGQVMGLMARAGVGKTALVCNLIANINRRERPHPVLFFSLEMPASEIAARIYSIDTGNNPRKVEEYFEKSMNDPRIAEWTRKYRLFVTVDDPGLTVKELEEKYNEATVYIGDSIPLVIIDYLGLLKGHGGSSYERVSTIARDLKNLAKRLSCAVIVLVQTSREGGNGGERITLSSARDSGVVEESMDFLLGAWRPELANNPAAEGKFMISVLKNRHGRTGETPFFFNKQNLRIQEEAGNE